MGVALTFIVILGSFYSLTGNLGTFSAYATQGTTATLSPVGTVVVSGLPVPTVSKTTRLIRLRVPDPTAYNLSKTEIGRPGYQLPNKIVVNDTASASIPALTVSGSSGPSVVAFTGNGFNGLNAATACACTPPDVQVAVGPRHVVEMVNVAGETFTRTGTSLSAFGLNGFFLFTLTDFLSDPKILYDGISERWFASIIDVTTDNIGLAVSTTSDPTSWVIYHLSAGTNLPDQPIIGIDDDKFVVSANDFGSGGAGSFVGFELWVLNKAEMLAGGTVDVVDFSPNSAYFSVHPVQSLGSTTTEYMVSVDSSGSTIVTLFSITGVPGVSTVAYATSSISIATTIAPPDAKQSGTTLLLATGDARVQDAAWFQNHLWFTFNDACIPPGDATIRSCIRLTELNTAGPSQVQDFDFGAKGKYYFYAALRTATFFLRAGDLDVVFGYSSGGQFPGLRVTGRSAGAAINTLQTSVVLKSGSQPNTGGRYGDYFGAALDPTNTNVVWVAGEYGLGQTSTAQWSTWIGFMDVTPV